MTLRRACVLACLWVGSVTTGCSKTGEGEKTAPDAAAAPNAIANARRGESSKAEPEKADANTQAIKTASYSGTYSLVPATVYIPTTKDYANVKQVKDDPSKHVGDGTLTVSIDAAGTVSGTIDTGPAAPARIEGTLVADEIRGMVRRTDTTDDGLTGTFFCKLAPADAPTGNLALTAATAAIVRSGTISLKRK